MTELKIEKEPTKQQVIERLRREKEVYVAAYEAGQKDAKYFPLTTFSEIQTWYDAFEREDQYLQGGISFKRRNFDDVYHALPHEKLDEKFADNEVYYEGWVIGVLGLWHELRRDLNIN